MTHVENRRKSSMARPDYRSRLPTVTRLAIGAVVVVVIVVVVAALGGVG